MATRHITQTVDDLDGSVLNEDDGKHVAFSVDGRAYEIDLSNENAAKLADAFAPFVSAARRVSVTTAGARSTRSNARSDVDLGEVRAWARENGYTVSDRGRVPQMVVDAFKAAQ